jgi:hypothetical protein
VCASYIHLPMCSSEELVHIAIAERERGSTDVGRNPHRNLIRMYIWEWDPNCIGIVPQARPLNNGQQQALQSMDRGL